MTLLAGIISRNEHQAVPESACKAMEQAISRNTNDEVSIFKDHRSCLMKVDIGAYGESAFRIDPKGAVSLLAGEPLLNLSEDDSWRSRTRDLDLLHEEWQEDKWSLLPRAQGVFSAIHYQPNTGTLYLVADKFSLRPLYYWISEKYVAFASALRILESVEDIPKVMDVRAITEIVSSGTALDNRTPYANIALVKAAEVIEVTEKNISRWKYWRWDDIPPSRDPNPKLLQEVYERFERAVTRRARGDTTTVAFLSGGLDSRCIVAALRKRNLRVHTFNFARPGTQDQVFGAEFARGAGTIHGELPMERVYPDWSSMMAEAWGTSKYRRVWPAERPGLVWSGRGGSSGFGHLFMSKLVVDLMRAGRVDAAIDAILAKHSWNIPRRLLKSDVFDTLSSVLRTGIREQLDDIHCEDPGRSFYIFKIIKQRPVFLSHFEDIDLHRLEYQLPFFDSDLVASIIAVPIDDCLGHGFYTKWLAYSPAVVVSVPWQTYPGQEPCPLPTPGGLVYQWDRSYQSTLRRLRKQEVLEQAAELLRADDFPDMILKKRYLQLATWVYKIGLQEKDYIIRAARTYYKHWTLCAGNYVLPSLTTSMR